MVEVKTARMDLHHLCRHNHRQTFQLVFFLAGASLVTDSRKLEKVLKASDADADADAFDCVVLVYFDKSLVVVCVCGGGGWGRGGGGWTWTWTWRGGSFPVAKHVA